MATFLPLPDFSTLAFGGLLEKNTPLICGGHSNISYETKCYEIGSNEIVAELNTPRCCGASVVINQNTLWVTGGSTKETKQTTEFVRINQPTLPGTQLVKSIHHYFSLLQKSCQYRDFRDSAALKKRSGNFTFNRGVHKFLKIALFL